jgi:hypothetical protein
LLHPQSEQSEKRVEEMTDKESHVSLDPCKTSDVIEQEGKTNREGSIDVIIDDGKGRRGEVSPEALRELPGVGDDLKGSQGRER